MRDQGWIYRVGVPGIHLTAIYEYETNLDPLHFRTLLDNHTVEKLGPPCALRNPHEVWTPPSGPLQGSVENLPWGSKFKRTLRNHISVPARNVIYYEKTA